MIAVRVEDTGGGGGIYGDSALVYVESGGKRRPLVGRWRFRVGAVSADLEGSKITDADDLYNR